MVFRTPSVADGEAGQGLLSKGIGSGARKMYLGEDLLLGKESTLNIHI